MLVSATKDTSISMRLTDQDLALIDQGAQRRGLSRTEFLRQSALQEAQNALLDDMLVRMSPADHAAFMALLEEPAQPPVPALLRRLARPAPWAAE
jgi:uncharacterized protein (DUF1778 family)